MKTFTHAGLLAVLALGCVASLSFAAGTTVTIRPGDVQSRTGARGSFYILNIEIPQGVNAASIDRVQVKFAVDVVRSNEEDSVATATVGLFPLTQTMGDARNATPEFNGAVPSVRPVPIGDNRIVKMDVTDIVKGWLVEPSSNHGLVIGTLTGPAVGTASLRTSSLGEDTAALVTLYYKIRFGERVSSRE
jgi:hypothetical protein